jgi:hypothetical protein
MERMIETLETVIPLGQTLRIQDGKGIALQVVTGCLWITQDQDPDDQVVGACESFRVSRGGLTLVHAAKETRVRIVSASQASMPTLTLGGGYREYGAGVVRSIFAEWAAGIRGWFAAGMRARVLRSARMWA